MENEGISLDELLNGAEAVEPQPETIGQPRDESGRFAPKEEQGEEPEQPVQLEAPPASEPEPQHIPIAALKDERAKRQQLEEQLRQYEAYFQQAQQQPVDPEVDPIAYVTAQVQDQLAPQVQQQMLQMRVEMTETMARQKWEDYDDKVELFKEEAAKNPFLVQQVVQAANPAEYAYNVASQIAQAKQYGGNQPSREQLKAEIREEIMAEIGTPNRQAPMTTATERSVGSRSGPAWGGPASLDDLLS